MNSDTGRYIKVKSHYVYNADQMAFDVEPIPIENAENSTVQDEPSPISDVSRYIGMEIAPDTVLPDDIKDCGGFIATEDYVFCIGVCEKDGVKMLWLEEITGRDSEGHAYFKVRDVLVLPEIEGADFCTMIRNGSYMYGAFGLAEYTDTQYYETVYRVWTVDREAKKIIEVPVDGYKGVNEGYGV